MIVQQALHVFIVSACPFVWSPGVPVMHDNACETSSTRRFEDSLDDTIGVDRHKVLG